MRLPRDLEGQRAADLVQVIKKHLSGTPRGGQVFAAFETDPDRCGGALADYLRDQLPNDHLLAEKIAAALGPDSGVEINNIVTGGSVDQILNIARLGVLNLTVKKQFFFFKNLRQLVVFLVLIAAAAGGVYLAVWYSRQPARMTHAFNIAVARFGEITDAGIKPSKTGDIFASHLMGFLDTEFKASGFEDEVEVSHSKMPLIQEDRDAESLAKRTNADVVIYGTVSVDGNQGEFSPRFYIAENPDTTYIAGQNELAKPIVFNVESKEQAAAELRQRSEILLLFTKGLVYMRQKNEDAGRQTMQEAINILERLPSPFRGEEIIYIMASQLQGESYEKAFDLLEKAFQLNPDSARAHIALGNIYYTMAVKNNFDAVLFDQALGEYQKASDAPNPPASSYIPEKSRCSIANIQVIRAQQTHDPALFAQATDNYTFVINRYQANKDNDTLRRLAPIAYFGLGAAYERQDKKQEAIQAYQNAYSVTGDQDFKNRIQAQIKIVRGNP